MKKISFAVLPLVAFMAVSCVQKTSVVAQIDGWGDDTIFVNSISQSGDAKQDTVVSVAGKFTYDVAPTDTVQLTFTRQRDIIESPSRGEYNLAANVINLLVLGGEKLSVEGKQETDRLVYTTKGSDFEVNRSKVNEETRELIAQVDNLQRKADSMILAKTERDVVMPLFEQQMAISNDIKKIELKYVLANPESELSAYLLAGQPIDTTAKYYESLSEGVRTGLFQASLDRNLKQYEKKLKKEAAKANIQVGKVAPNFTLVALDGTPFSLYDIQDKYVMLDFWGSWCGWCVKGFPDMKKCYAKHSNKMEIVGIDCGDKEEVWKSAVAKLELPWTQVINGEGENDMTTIYAVEGFPTKIIIAPDHTIVEVVMGETEDFYTNIDKLLK